MTTVLELKKKEVEEIVEDINSSEIILFTDYRGLTVNQFSNLKKELRKEQARIKVSKNTLIRRALSSLSIEYPKEYVVGPSALVSTKGDLVNTVKVITKFSKESEVLVIKGGILEKSIIDEPKIQQIAKMPSKQELIGKVVGGIKSPITNLVICLSSPTRGLMNVLNAIANKKENNEEVK